MKPMKKVLATFLVLALLVSLLPIHVNADSSIIIEAENSFVSATGGWSQNEVRVTNDVECSGGKFYFVQGTSSTIGNQVRFNLSAPEDGLYDVYVTTKDNPDRAILQFAINDNILNEIDLFNETPLYREHKVGTVSMSAGDNTLTATITGKNPASTSSNYGVVFDCFRFVKVENAPEELKIEAETAFSSAEGQGSWMQNGVRTTSDEECSDGKFYFVQGSSDVIGNKVHFKLNVPIDDTYDVYVTTKDNPDRAILQFAINDSILNEIDLFNETPLYREHKVGTVSMSAGDNTLTATITGKNQTSTSSYYGAVFDCFRIITSDNDPTPPEGSSYIYNNEDESYNEVEGDWTTIDGVGHNGSNSRIAEDNATAVFSDYPPSTGNFAIDWYVPVDNEDKVSITINTLDGMWKYSLPENCPVGWTRIGVIKATEGTAFVLSAVSENLCVDAIRLTPVSYSADPVYTPTGGGSDEVAVLVNQIGYDNGKSKRATVTNVENGTAFKVINAGTGETAFSGAVEDGIADFSNLNSKTDTDYYITCETAQSYLFTIGNSLIQRCSVTNALAFMNETRADTFKWGNAGVGWRDSHQFSFELPSLALQYMANPALFDNLPYSIVSVDTCEYSELRIQDEPDIIWLMQFAAMRYYDWGANDGKKLHMLIKEQLAWFLYIYPEIKDYVDNTFGEDFYETLRTFTIQQWSESTSNMGWYTVGNTNHDLFSVQTEFGSLKGNQPPGHSILPNLLMYEVAMRDGLDSELAQRFFDAAYDNALYTIELDIANPRWSKGQRMSEHVTVEGLSWYLEKYPDRAPVGLRNALQHWANKMIARSDNMWDMRMAASLKAGDDVYTLGFPTGNKGFISKDYWTGAAYAIADDQGNTGWGVPQNEPGNTAGFQAITYAAARVLDDATSTQLKNLGIAAIDDLFGRNPTGRAAFYHFTRDFDGGDLGWYKQYQGGNGLLGGCTAVIDANAPESCYPYAPENYNTGYTEGWVAYNTAWNNSLAYSAAEDVKLTVPTSGEMGESIALRLKAPINLDPGKVEKGYVFITDPTSGVREKVEITETSPDSMYFEGNYALPNAPYVTVSYGSGIFMQAAEIDISGFEGVNVSSIILDAESMELTAGDSNQLTAIVSPDNATDKRLNFVSDNPEVASVNAQGIINAKAGGEASIIVSSVSNPSVTASCIVTVKAARPIGLQISAPSTIQINEKKGKAVVTGIVYSDGSIKAAELPLAVFTTSDTTIDLKSDGTIKALRTGTANIKVTAIVGGISIIGTAKIEIIATDTTVSYDLLKLFQANKYSADSGASASEITDGSINLQRVRLMGTQVDGTVTFVLDNLPVGTYQLTLNSKYYDTYGTWSFMFDNKPIGTTTDFNNAEKNGRYHDLYIDEVMVTGEGPHSFSFVSVLGDNKTLVPVSLGFTPISTPDHTDVDKSVLDTLISECENEKEEDYTPGTWRTFVQVFAEVQAILDAENATQIHVQAAIDALTTARAGLIDRPIVTVYTITFNANGGSCAPEIMQTDENGKLAALPEASRTGNYRFDGWFDAKTDGNLITTDTVFTENTTAYAYWTYLGGDAPADKPPSITNNPEEQSVLVGETATFTVKAEGTAPLSYQWQINRDDGWVDISGVTGASYITPVVKVNDNGFQYRCVVSNSVGSVVSEAAVLTVTNLVEERYTVTFDANGGVCASETMQTDENGKLSALPDASRTGNYRFDGWFDAEIKGNRVTTNTVFTSNTTIYAYWIYLGDEKPTNTAPYIIHNPDDQNVLAGEAATFAVSAGGTKPLSYQWQIKKDHDWVDIESATNNSYTVYSAETEDNGNQYRCVVSNEYGSVISNSAKLVVNKDIDTEIPKTGDNGKIGLHVGIVILIAALFIGIAIHKRRQNTKES